MKKKNPSLKKLSVKKETITNLGNLQSNRVKGGSVFIDPRNSYACSVGCPFGTP